MPGHPTDDRPLWERALARDGGQRYWRSVRELGLAGGDRLREFPPGSDGAPDWRLGRRDLMKLLGASVALAGLGGCVQRPQEQILPYAQQPPELTPGLPRYYATSMVLDGFATGLLAESHEGRPTKLEGNPDHPASLGATGLYEQASVLSLYDPDRCRAPRRGQPGAGLPVAWDEVLRAIARPRAEQRPPWFVLYPQSSPALAAVIARVRERSPEARFTYHSPVDRRPLYQAARLLFDRPLEAQYDFTRARVILALDADFTGAMPMSLRWARDFARGRRPGAGDAMNRLYMLETMLSPTGSLADHRLALRPSELRHTAAALLGEFLATSRSAAAPPGFAAALPRAADTAHPAWIRAVVRDLARVPGASIVVAGDRQPLEVQLVAHLLNAALGNLGRTVTLTPPALLEPEGGEPLEALVAAIRSGAVDTVAILEANPVYTAPELDLGRWLRQVPNSFHLTYHDNETSRACRWILPAAHYLESWGDARAYDGTLSFVQPLIEPLYPARTPLELLAAFAGEERPRGHALVRARWDRTWHRTRDGAWNSAWDRQRGRAGSSQAAGAPPAAASALSWEELLQRGLAPDSAFAAVPVEPRWAAAAAPLRRAAAPVRPDAIELHLEPSPAVYDGRFANNAWLQELPRPMTKQCWGNAAIMSPRTAVALGATTGRVVELGGPGRALRVAALVLPGHADGAITLELGYGRDAAETLARGVGVDAYRLRGAPGGAPAALRVRPTARVAPPVLTQEHWEMHDRPLALHATLAHYRAHPDFTEAHHGPLPSLLPQLDRTGVQWAMTIDTGICTGCSACVVACQAENNIPVVGAREVARSREMHWLRIDRYFSGPVSAPEVINQPMLCQHCEKAPCEYVCPVNATVHSPDGLNEMVYNRCIGTRFCSNNCPYKVRRYNWFEYTEDRTAQRMQRNPDVTVRERGVMEKCTYCVQRIRGAELAARVENRAIRPGEVVTACQQACPTRAIQFASLTDRDSDMVKWRREPRRYAVLHELGTRPRTLYLARISNPNPELG